MSCTYCNGEEELTIHGDAFHKVCLAFAGVAQLVDIMICVPIRWQQLSTGSNLISFRELQSVRFNHDSCNE